MLIDITEVAKSCNKIMAFCDYLIIKLLLVYHWKENFHFEWDTNILFPFPHMIFNFLPFPHKVFSFFCLFLKLMRKRGFMLHAFAKKKTEVLVCKRWREKQNCDICNLKVVLTNSNFKLLLNIKWKYRHETYALLRLWQDYILSKFLSNHILQGEKPYM